MLIRREVNEDFEQIYTLVKNAFQTAKVKDGDEQDYVNQLRDSSNYIPELALVAEENGRLIGHIMLTKTSITGADRECNVLLLSPVCVALGYRNRGVGSALIRESLRLARELRYVSVFLVGDPEYYSRFSFRAAVNYGIRHIQDIPEENVMVCELIPNSLAGINGTIDIV